MGRGDVKSRQGKIWRGSYGKRRPKPKEKRNADTAASKKNAVKKTAAAS